MQYTNFYLTILIAMHLPKTTTILLLLFSLSCTNNKGSHPIKIYNAFVQSWSTATGKNRGTTVEVNLSGKIKDIKILAIVYNKQQTTPVVQPSKNLLTARADFEKGTEKVFHKSVFSNKHNMVIYSYRGKVYELPIHNFLRKDANYYPVK